MTKEITLNGPIDSLRIEVEQIMNYDYFYCNCAAYLGKSYCAD